jgi:hypothetical protein
MPPKFKDFAKSVNTLLGDGPDAFGEGDIGVEYKFSAPNGVKVTFEGTKNDEGAISFTNESEYTTGAGITLVEKFDSAKKTIELTGKYKKLLPGLAVNAVSLLSTDGGLVEGKELTLKGDYKAGDLIADYKITNVMGFAGEVGVSYAFDKFLFGTAFNLNGLEAPWAHKKGFAVGFGYADGDVSAVTRVHNSGTYDVSLWHAASDALKAGMQYHSSGTISVGTDYKIDEDSTIRTRFVAADKQELTASFSQKIKSNVNLTLVTKCDVADLKAGKSSVGMKLAFSS